MSYDVYLAEWYCPRCEPVPSRTERDVGVRV